mmetsp:Transcript_95511/g.218698  ORF Transcript_95511/g.218698 Transcript_95511/m.218698 type:complete len:225 (-) Transcript_95511:1632-2306(-)
MQLNLPQLVNCKENTASSLQRRSRLHTVACRNCWTAANVAMCSHVPGHLHGLILRLVELPSRHQSWVPAGLGLKNFGLCNGQQLVGVCLPGQGACGGGLKLQCQSCDTARRMHFTNAPTFARSAQNAGRKVNLRNAFAKAQRAHLRRSATPGMRVTSFLARASTSIPSKNGCSCTSRELRAPSLCAGSRFISFVMRSAATLETCGAILNFACWMLWNKSSRSGA